MPLHLTWPEIAVRLLLACAASFIIGLNRDEDGHPAGVRTTMLVCLAATLAELQLNLLLPLAGRTPSSFIKLDLERLPLGILSGIGFIGAGVILKRDNRVTGVTTAATLWFVTVLGLLFGGGQLILGCAGSAIGIAVLWVLKLLEHHMPRLERAWLTLRFDPEVVTEEELRQQILGAAFQVAGWKITYQASGSATVRCRLKRRRRGEATHGTPPEIAALRSQPGVRSSTWGR